MNNIWKSLHCLKFYWKKIPLKFLYQDLFRFMKQLIRRMALIENHVCETNSDS